MSATNLPKPARKIARALIEVVKPQKPGFDLPLEDYMLEFLDEFYSHFPVHMKLLFPVGLYLLEFGTFIFERKPRRFSRMSLPEREQYVKGWVESRLMLRRDLIKGVKGVCLTGFYSHPEVMAHIGYDLPAHLERVDKGEPCDAEACRFFRELGYDDNRRIPYPAFDRCEVICHDTPSAGARKTEVN